MRAIRDSVWTALAWAVFALGLAVLGLIFAALAAGCAASSPAGDAGELLDAPAPVYVDAMDACIRATNANQAANVRLGCHVIASCAETCGTPPTCSITAEQRDACIAARAASTSCADLAPPACAFSREYPEGGL